MIYYYKGTYNIVNNLHKFITSRRPPNKDKYLKVEDLWKIGLKNKSLHFSFIFQFSYFATRFELPILKVYVYYVY